MTFQSPAPATLARRISLVLILFFGTQTLVAGLRGLPGGQSAFFLCLYIHLWASIYDGIFERGRKLSWLALNLSWIGSVFAGFLGYVLPSGQMLGWFATVVANHFGEQLATDLFANLAWLSPLIAGLAVVPSLLLILDIVLMQRQGSALRTGPWRLLVPAVCALGLGATTAMLANPPAAGLSADPTLALPPILPEWFGLPLYAILRCIPDKLAGVILMFAAMLPPLVAPWIGAAHCRVGPARHFFMVLCTILALSWLLLGWLGAQEVTALSSWAVRILTLYYFCFFLVCIPVLSRWSRHRQVLRDSRALSSFD